MIKNFQRKGALFLEKVSLLSRTLQQVPTFSRAGGTMRWRDPRECLPDFILHVEADLRDQVVQALILELTLHFREDGLDRVELGAVCHVVDRPDV